MWQSVSYATDKMRNAAENGLSTSEKATRALVSKAKVKMKEHRIKSGYAASAEASVKSAEEMVSIKTRNFANKRQVTRRIGRARKADAARRYANERLAISSEERMRKAAMEAVKETKRIGKATIKAVRMIIENMKTLVQAITAGGWIAIIAIVVCCLFGAAFYMFGDESSGNYTPVSAEVEDYSPVIQKYCQKYGISEYTELVKAVMMQESGGKGKDPMQSSEGPFNKKYSKQPNGITDPDYSISCGVQEVASCLKQAKCKSPLDMSHIRLALQGYNYGNGYISWAVK